MDRIIVYPGSVPQDTDLLNTNRNTMIALGALMQATLGSVPIIDGLAVTPTSPAGMAVQVGPGSITQITALDANAYGTLGADTVDPCLKMGINTTPTTFSLAAPASAGTAINYLIQASFQEADVNAAVLAYYDAANPTLPWLGPANAGTAQSTLRAQRVALTLKAGTAAATGTQATPAPDSGAIGIAAIVVTAGTTSVLASAIVPLPGAPQALFKLPYLRPGFSAVEAFTASATFTVPIGVTRAKITVIGGGGAGGTHATLPSGGGGAGGQAVAFAGYLVPGTQIPITVGAGGVALTGGAVGQGGNGGTSSFGTIVSATGGQGGVGGTVAASSAGGPGGTGVGGDINYGGAYGTDGIELTGRGGDGGGPGGGRGTSSLTPGIAGQGYGGGGGGGGSSTPGGAGTGAPGGNGAGGIVIVEF